MENENNKVTNPLLDALRIPGSTFRLPSQGLFYDVGVLAPDVKNGEIEVYPMTAYDEIILATPDKLLSGKAILEVFSRTIPQILKPGQLLAKDVDFLMACLRNVSFGGFMPVTFEHSCEHSKEHEYNVDLDSMIRRTKQLDPTSLSGEYSLTMPNGQVVVLKPLTYDTMVDLYQTTLSIKTDNITEAEAETLVISSITSVIDSVAEVKDRGQIREWVCNIPLGWKRQIEKAASDVTQWGIDFTYRTKCKDCAGDIEIQVTPNPVNFFT